MEKHDAQHGPLIYTIGHSTRPLGLFIDMLAGNEIGLVLDVRTIPHSRRNPQYSQETLPLALRASNIGYRHLPGLGGLRHARKDSINRGWRNASFRGYADYMQTPDFTDNIRTVVEIAASGPCALMCAEAVPWRCHRSLIADALVLRGLCVEHIMGVQERKPHVITPWARTDGLEIVYPPADEGIVDR
ncbi:uncharacterized protein DUF488 [Nitrosospira sp. Nsp2]|uniref:DUF488 domain-containing protein n=1 Tax=Nitrosospira sp. Nsp2 TaxID=136548 RepID=UPI000D320846|nr:DUF488 domain-containing protein [Nitrosospira sp. Nsp2]PTR17279.1 uncharacterized protein DUF488 [Nitrosospira sp. Nsp2]